MKFDHVALKSSNIEKSIEYYKENFNAKVLYEDESWGLIECCGVKIAFVLPSQHPPHLGFVIDQKQLEEKFSENVFKRHRDGTSSCYIKDVDGNFLEFVIYENSK